MTRIDFLRWTGAPILLHSGIASQLALQPVPWSCCLRASPAAACNSFRPRWSPPQS